MLSVCPVSLLLWGLIFGGVHCGCGFRMLVGCCFDRLHVAGGCVLG